MPKITIYLQFHQEETDENFLDWLQKNSPADSLILGTYSLDTRFQKWVSLQEDKKGNRRILLFEK